MQSLLISDNADRSLAGARYPSSSKRKMAIVAVIGTQIDPFSTQAYHRAGSCP
jgi:hypothetical protein